MRPRGTDFQRRVWDGLMAIGYGRTESYAELARRIGRPRAVRAVGAANGANPLSIVVPCHRVIGADGSLTGYGGGLEAKRWLLAHERRHARWPEAAGGLQRRQPAVSSRSFAALRSSGGRSLLKALSIAASVCLQLRATGWRRSRSRASAGSDPGPRCSGRPPVPA